MYQAPLVPGLVRGVRGGGGWSAATCKRVPGPSYYVCRPFYHSFAKLQQAEPDDRYAHLHGDQR